MARTLPGSTTFAMVLWSALFLVMVERAMAMVFVLNFSTDGPGPTLWLILLALTGLLYLVGFQRTWPHRAGILRPAAVASVVAIAASRLSDPMWAAIGSFAALATMTPLLVSATATLRGRAGTAAALGVLLHGALRGLWGHAPFHATTTGQVLVVGLAVAAAVPWLGPRPAQDVRSKRGSRPSPPLDPPRWGPAVLWAYLLGNALWLGVVPAVAHWHLVDMDLVAAAMALGIVAGVMVPLGRHVRPTLAAGTIAAAALLVWVPAAAWLWAGLVHFGAALLVRAACGGAAAPIRSVAWRLLGVQTAWLALALLHGSAPNWAFMPPPLDTLSHGTGPLTLFLVLSLVALGSWRPRPAPSASTRSIMAGIVTALLLVGGTAVHTTPAGPGPEPETLRVLEYNVHQYYNGHDDGRSNLYPLAAEIEAAVPHVVGLQETDGTRITSGHVDGVAWLGDRLGMHHAVASGTNTMHYGVAILSVWPITETTTIELPARESVERQALLATLDAPWGPLHVVVTHLQTQEYADDRLAQVAAIQDATAHLDRFILLGDTNTEPGEAAYEALETTWTDAWTAAAEREGDGLTASTPEPHRRIDQVWLRGDWTVLAARTVGDVAVSDHLGVLVVLEVPA